MRVSTKLHNLFDTGFNFSNAPDGNDGHIHNDVINGFDYFDTIFKFGDKYFQGTVNIKNIKSGRLFKDVTKIKDVTEDISSSYAKNPKSTFLRTSSVNSIPENSENNKEKYSLSDNLSFDLDRVLDGTFPKQSGEVYVGGNRGKRRARIMLITDKLDDNGNNAVIIEQVDIDGLVDGSKLEVNRIITAYGKSYICDIIQDVVATDMILFCQKNKVSTIAWYEDVQFVNRMGSAYFANNIDDFWANVNWNAEKTKKGSFPSQSLTP